MGHPFLRLEIIKFQVNHGKQSLDLSEVKTEIEIKEKSLSSKATNARKQRNACLCASELIVDGLFRLARIKKPVFNEANQSIRFDVGLFTNTERYLTIRIHFQETLFSCETDSKSLQKLANGLRHQVMSTVSFLWNVVHSSF